MGLPGHPGYWPLTSGNRPHGGHAGPREMRDAYFGNGQEGLANSGPTGSAETGERSAPVEA